MIEELLILKAEAEMLKNAGKLEAAKEIQAIIDNMTNGVPKGSSHGTD